MSQNKIVIRDAQVVSDGRMERKSVLIANGRISQLIADGQPVPEADEVVEAQDLVLMPGAIDDHVHFRDPGLTHKATMRSESAAAVAGGVTSVMDMPNTVPSRLGTPRCSRPKAICSPTTHSILGPQMPTAKSCSVLTMSGCAASRCSWAHLRVACWWTMPSRSARYLPRPLPLLRPTANRRT